MKKISVNSNFTIFDNIDDLPIEVKDLVEKAKKLD